MWDSISFRWSLTGDQTDLCLSCILLQFLQPPLSAFHCSQDNSEDSAEHLYTLLSTLWAQDTADLWPLTCQLSVQAIQLCRQTLKKTTWIYLASMKTKIAAFFFFFFWWLGSQRSKLAHLQPQEWELGLVLVRHHSVWAQLSVGGGQRQGRSVQHIKQTLVQRLLGARLSGGLSREDTGTSSKNACQVVRNVKMISAQLIKLSGECWGVVEVWGGGGGTAAPLSRFSLFLWKCEVNFFCFWLI